MYLGVARCLRAEFGESLRTARLSAVDLVMIEAATSTRRHRPAPGASCTVIRRASRPAFAYRYAGSALSALASAACHILGGVNRSLSRFTRRFAFELPTTPSAIVDVAHA